MVWGTISLLGAFAEGVGKVLNYPLLGLYEFMVLPGWKTKRKKEKSTSNVKLAHLILLFDILDNYSTWGLGFQPQLAIRQYRERSLICPTAGDRSSVRQGNSWLAWNRLPLFFLFFWRPGHALWGCVQARGNKYYHIVCMCVVLFQVIEKI